MMKRWKIWLLIVLMWTIYWIAMFGMVAAGERDSRWHSLRNDIVQNHPYCAACGSKTKLEAHHILPVQFWPEKELDRDNVIVLCDWCHYVIGHLNNNRSYNPYVREDAAEHMKRVKARPKTKADLGKFEQEFATAP